MKSTRQSVFLALSLIPSWLLGAAAAPPAAVDPSVAATKITWVYINSPELDMAEEQLQVARQQLGDDNPRVKDMKLDLDMRRRTAQPQMSLDFPGGSLQSLVTAIEKSNGRVSFSLIGGAVEPRLPPFKLQNTDLKILVGVVGTLLDERGWSLRVIDNPDRNKVVAVLVDERGRRGGRADAGGGGSLAAIQLGDYIDNTQPVEMIVETIRTAWELDPTADRSKLLLKYQPDTKMLLVSGPPPAADIAVNVVNALQKKTAKR